MAPQPISELLPRVRRAVEGPIALAPGDPDKLTDGQLKQLVADSIASIILYTGGVGGVFGKKLLVTDSEGGAPSDYAVDPPLELPEQTVIANQAALDHFFHLWKDRKLSERIEDEAQAWEYSLSAQFTRDQLQSLVAERDRAIAALSSGHALDSYVSLIEARDVVTARVVEPWATAGGVGGLY